jgi:hypothetical protein
MKKKTNKILCTTLDQILVVLVFLVYAIMLPAKASSQDSQFGKAPVSASHMSASRMALSFSLQEWGNEFGTGFQITSPWFWHEKTAVRLGGSALWKQDANWATFYALRLGLVGATFMRNEDIRLYGEGGFLFLFPSASFDSDPFAFGGYGHFGFEFFMPKAIASLSSSYFIELGTNGVGAKTDIGQSYLNGFSVSTGLRVYL